MEVAQLKTVREVYKAGSLSKASMRLNKAPSIISRQVSALEKEFGARIFHRTGRGVELTELGEQILPQIDQLIAAMERMLETGKKHPEELSGEVRVFISSAICDSFVVRLVSAVKEAYPCILLQISEGYSVEIALAMERSSADVAVFLRNGRTVAPGEEPIGEFDTYLVGRPGDPLLAGREILLSELQGLPLVIPSEPSLARYAIGDLAASRGIELTIVTEVNSSKSSRALLAAGAGYGIAPVGCGPARELGAIGEWIGQGVLQGARIRDPDLKRTLVVRANTSKKDRVDAVRKTAIDVLRQLKRETELEPLQRVRT